MLSTGLPFKAPQQAHHPAQCDHLRLSETTFCFGELQIDIPKKERTTAAAHPPKKKTQITRSKMVQNKMTEVTGFHRSFKVSLQCRAAAMPLWKVPIRAHLSACISGPHLAIYKRICCSLILWLCSLMSRVCLANESITPVGDCSESCSAIFMFCIVLAWAAVCLWIRRCSWLAFKGLWPYQLFWCFESTLGLWLQDGYNSPYHL